MLVGLDCGGALSTPSAGGSDGEPPAEVSTADAAKLLAVSQDTLLRWKNAGRLEYRKLAPPDRSRSTCCLQRSFRRQRQAGVHQAVCKEATGHRLPAVSATNLFRHRYRGPPFGRYVRWRPASAGISSHGCPSGGLGTELNSGQWFCPLPGGGLVTAYYFGDFLNGVSLPVHVLNALDRPSRQGRVTCEPTTHRRGFTDNAS
jgi:hypothetical protein